MGYRHTQFGSVTVAVFISLGIRGVARPIPLVVMLFLGLALIVFHYLTIEIIDTRLVCRFGPGIIKKTFLLSEIDDAKKVRIPRYTGWGMRWMPGQYLLWRVSGFHAVELDLKDGGRFRIGTDVLDMLVEAIQSNRRTGYTPRQVKSHSKGI